MVLNVHRNHKAYYGQREGGMVGGGGGVEIIQLSLHCHHWNALRWAAMTAILMFRNCEGQSQKTVSTNGML